MQHNILVLNLCYTLTTQHLSPPFLSQLQSEQSQVIKQCLLYGAAHYGTLLHHYLVLQNPGVLQAVMLAQIAAHLVSVVFVSCDASLDSMYCGLTRPNMLPALCSNTCCLVCCSEHVVLVTVSQVWIAYSKGLFHSPGAATTTLTTTTSISDASIMKAPTKAVADAAGMEDTGNGTGAGSAGGNIKPCDSDVNSSNDDPTTSDPNSTNTNNNTTTPSRSKATPLSPDNTPANTYTETSNQDFTLSRRAIHTFNSDTSNTSTTNTVANDATVANTNTDATSEPSGAGATAGATTGGGTSGGMLSGLASAPLGECFIEF